MYRRIGDDDAAEFIRKTTLYSGSIQLDGVDLSGLVVNDEFRCAQSGDVARAVSTMSIAGTLNTTSRRYLPRVPVSGADALTAFRLAASSWQNSSGSDWLSRASDTPWIRSISLSSHITSTCAAVTVAGCFHPVDAFPLRQRYLKDTSELAGTAA